MCACVQLAPDQGLFPADHPTELRRRCEDEAQQMVQLGNSVKEGQQNVTNPGLTHLISRLTALLLQIKVRGSITPFLCLDHTGRSLKSFHSG